jgi:ligand-binding sensor domain-containing protein
MATAPVHFTYTPTVVALWSVEYVVYDYRERIVDFGVRLFAVSYYQVYPEGWAYQGTEVRFSVTTERERFVYGSPANFTFHLWNDGDTAQNVTVTWGVHHHTWYGIVPAGIYDAFATWIVVPAAGYASFNYTLPAVVDYMGDRLRAKLYVDGSWVGTVEKGIYAYGGSYVRANLEFDMTTDRAAYRSGDTVTITLNVTSTLDFAYTTRLNLLVGRVGRGDDLWSTPYDLHVLNASSAVSVFTVTLPQATLDGRYFVRVRSGRWAWAYAYFTVLPYEVDIAVVLPDVYRPHTPAAGTLTLNNTGDQDLRNTTVTVAFLDPDQRTVWNATAAFPLLAVNQTAALPFAIPVSAVRLGVYQFAYHVTFDPQKTVAGTVDLPSSLRVDLAFDRAAYRARDDVGVTVDVVNDGVFVQNRSLRLDVPDIGYTATWELQVHPGHAERVDVVVPLPSNSTVGVHDVHLAVQDDGNWTASTYRFTIPESQLRVALGEARYDGGDDAQIVLRNLGGVDTEVEYAIALLGPTGPVAPPRNATATILAGSAVGTTYPLPRSLLTGPYDLRVATRNARTNTTRTTRLPLWLDGLRVDVTVTTDRDVYRPSDSVTVTGQLTNAGALLENGTLHLEIVAALPGMTAANWTTYVPLPIGLVDVIAFDPAGNAWLGGYGFVVRYQDGAWDHYAIQDGLPGTIITSLVVDAGGQVWVGADSSTAGLSVFDGAGWTRLNATNTGLTFPFTTALAIGPDGDVWVGSRSDDGVHRFNGTHWTTYNTTNSGMVSNRVGCIAVDDDGTAWFGGGRWDEYGVTRYNGTHWTTYDASHTGINRDRVDAITFDRDGHVWIAHDHYLGGISVYNGTHWTTYRRASNELPDYAVRALTVDADGHVWAATGGGVAVFNGTTWTHHTTGTSGVESNDLEAIAVDAAGQVWVGYNDFPGVSRYDGAQWARLVPTIIDDTVYDVTVDADGVVWFATHWGISRYDGDAWTYLTTTTSGLLSDTVYVLEFDHAGHVWAGTPQGISAYNGTGWTSYDEATTGVDLSSMQAFAADPYGNLWFASKLKTGAVRFNGTHWTTYNTTTSSLASDDVRALLVDAYGDLWIATDRGVNWHNRTHWRLYNASHSALGSDDVIDLALDAQNRVWIVHGTGVSAFDRTTWTTFDPQLFEDLEVALGYFSTIALDPHDRVWVGASRTFTMGGRGYGVLTYDGHAWTKYNVTNSGLASNFVNAIGFVRDDVWFGTNGHGASRLAATVAEPSPVLWQANVTLNLLESAVNTTTIAVGPLGVTGKLHLRGHLQSAEGRGIASDVHPFYIVDGDLLLTFDLDDAVYKLGESVTLTGAVRNLDPAQAYDGLTVTLRDGATLVYQASVDLPANGTYPFATSFVAASAGEHTLEATVVQNSATLVTVRDQYTAATPSVVVEVTAPEVVGWDPFPITVRVNNTGATDATVTVNGTTVTLIPGAVRFLELIHQVDRTTTYALVVTGDYDATLLVDVVLGASATLTLTPASVYPEGFVAIPYAIVNTGSLDVNATVTFTLNASTAMRAIFVPPMQTLTGHLLYNLSDGAYTLGYSSVFGSGHVAVTVVTPDQIDVTLHDRERVNGTLRVPVTVTNVGANAVAGTIRLRSDVYTGEEPFTLPTGTSQYVVWNVSLLDVQAGTYPVAVQVLVDGAMLQAIDFTIHAARPRFVVDVPVNASFPWGALANLTLTVRNAGDAAGDAAVTLTMPGIHEEVQSTGIPGGSTTPFTFAVPIPDDLAAGWYPAVYALNGVRYETTVHVEGANVSVTASSDQSLYAEGANATVTLRIANRNGLPLSLVATVHSDAYAALVPFNLSSGGEAVLTFDVPVGFEGQPSQTILYTVSLASGRALYIGDLYLYARPPASSGIMLSTDRQVYAIGDTVTVTVTASWTGAFTASAPNFVVEEDLDEGPRVYTFTVPELLSGTYAIDYTFDGYAGSYPFDVNGYSARIVELTLDKTAYAVGEDVRLEMEVEARRAFAALLRVTVYDQFSVPIDRYTVNVTLVAGANRIAVTRPIPRGGLGLYAINPRIYVDLPAHSYVLVTSGARFFDVTADAVPPLVTITSPTDATDLAGTIWLNVTVNEAVAWMRYSLDGDANVTLTTNHALLELTPGSHAVTVYATDPSGNLGASTAAFTVVPVDDAPPDPVVLAAPSGITHAAMTLTWTATTAVDFANYTVYQTTVQSTLGTAIATITDASTTTYAVIGLAPETTYYHTVRVTDTGGQYADSDTVSATTTAAPPPPPTEFPWVYLLALVAVVGVVAVVLVRKSIV